MLRWGIPAYRLPVNVLDYEVELIRRKGVTFVYNSMIGKDLFFDKIRNDYAAVFIAVGAQKGAVLNVKGDDLEGVVQGLEFLYRASTEGDKQLKGHVILWRRR
jgi:NADPH-dependent glutamate synthase beta subunit-like oxidoreductase